MRPQPFLTAAAICLILLTVGCQKGSTGNANRETRQSPLTKDSVAATNKEHQSPAVDAGMPKKINNPAYSHLHNLIQVSDSIYSGAEPHDEKSFAELARLGVKTVVSVDGARPDVETAEKFGLRYVHIPIGYDGVPKVAGDAFAQLMCTAEGPFYIHCHHGKHRGPTGAAVACIAAGERNGTQALEILKLAGTSKDYPGLWRDVEGYTPPPADAELPELVSVAEVGSMAVAMAQIDRSNDNLKLIAVNAWKPVAEHPDIAPAQEALLLKEGLVEAARNQSADYDQQFRDWMEEAAAAAGRLEEALKQNDVAAANEHFQALNNSCKKCHADYRN